MNIELKLEAIKLFAAMHRLPDTTFKDKYDLSRTTLCPKGAVGEYQRKCLERSCLDCGTSAIQIKLQPFLETHIDETVTYKWENVPFVVGGHQQKNDDQAEENKASS